MPVAPFLSAEPTGRSVSFNTTDVHYVEDGRIVRTYHLEKPALAMRQLAGEG